MDDAGSGFRVQGSGFSVQGSGFRVQGGRVQGVRVQGSGFRVEGVQFRRGGNSVAGVTLTVKNQHGPVFGVFHCFRWLTREQENSDCGSGVLEKPGGIRD